MPLGMEVEFDRWMFRLGRPHTDVSLSYLDDLRLSSLDHAALPFGDP